MVCVSYIYVVTSFDGFTVLCYSLKIALTSIYFCLQGTTTSFLAEDSVPMERYVAVESALSTANVSRQVNCNVTTYSIKLYQKNNQ